MFRFILLVCGLTILTTSAGCAVTEDPPLALLTLAERSGFKATAKHAEVIELLDRIAEASPVVTRSIIGWTGEGREIPALIIADPPIATAEEAAAQVRDQNKLVVIILSQHFNSLH